jgi:Xaa-Pro aminopeptidase
MFPLDRHQPYLTPESEIEKRIQSFQKRLKESQTAVAWIDYPPDRLYFTGSNQDGVLMIPEKGDPLYFVRKSLTRAEHESPLKVQPWPGRKSLLNRARELLRVGDSLGFDFYVTPASTFVWLKSKLENYNIGDISGLIRHQKAVKSHWEIEQIRKASDQVLPVFEEMDRHLKPGITELEVSASIERHLRLGGHTGTIWIRRPGMDLGNIVLISGNGALYPTNFDGPDGGEGLYHGSPNGAGWKTIHEGETVMADMVSAYNGYHGDNARTFYMGSNLPQKARDAHTFCIRMLDKLESELKPGNHCETIYKDVKAWAEDRGLPEGFMGFGENQVKFFGHGIGMELDEMPILADKIDLILEPGMVIAVEPKAFLKDIGGVGLENTYIITETGCENLCPFEREIICLG